jgi:IS5 family transposase
MRKKNQEQLPLMASVIEHPRAKELEQISQILDSIPTINEMVLQDLTRGGRNNPTGAEGMTAEQIVRAAIIKKIEEFTYEELAFHLADSRTYRTFCRIGIAHKAFKKSALCRNIKSISPETWEAIDRLVLAYGEDQEIEKGKQSRIDCTVVLTNIHEPTDSSLLWDCVRVITRILVQINERFEAAKIPFSDHTKRAKRRMMGVLNAKNEKVRKRQYEDLLKVTEKTVGYAESALPLLKSLPVTSAMDMVAALSMADELKRIQPLARKIMDQTVRRVIHGEAVPAHEKVVSIFEPHTDIIVKDRRDTFYGHKVCLSGGPSNLITDCLIVEGNPADVTLTTTMLDRHREIYGRVPVKAALDGGFASKKNLRAAKGNGVKDVCFAKKRGLKEEDMCKSPWVYKRLRRFRAGIESGISWLKRSLGLDRCTWKSFRSFKSYVWASIVSANLLTMARKLLTPSEVTMD